MPNYLIQEVRWMPAGHRFRLIKTVVAVGLAGNIIETDVGVEKPFETEYFPTRSKAMARRKELVATSDEPILGVVDFFYVRNADVAEWLYDSGRLIGIENYEAWFETLPKGEQSRYKIEFMNAIARTGNQQTTGGAS